MRFDLTPDLRRKLGYKLIDHIDAFYSSLPDRPVQQHADQRTYGPLDDPMPEEGADPAQVLDDICREMVDQGFHVPAANYFGLMNPTPTYMGFLGEALVAGLNPQLATLARSQLASKIEVETLRWIGERVGWPGSFNGTFTSGGNEANFSGLALALAWKFPNAIDDGVVTIGAQPVAYASAESHHSLDKSAGLMGIGRKALRRVALNQRLQIDPGALSLAIESDLRAGRKPFCVVATAGTTSSGIIDDLPAIAEVCRRHQLWLHVDGAYGASLIFSDKHRLLIRGIEQADSITIDPHKWLAVPFAAGVILTSHPEILERAFAVYAPYMPKADGAILPDNSKISTQWTRRMNAMKLWLTLKVHGRRAYEEHIDRQMNLARAFADWVTNSGPFELSAPMVVPILNLRLKGIADPKQRAALHNAIVDDVTRDGQRWISETIVDGESVIRVMVVSYLTEERHLEALQRALVIAAGSRLSAVSSAEIT
ncbi:MAG TPA: pyridoxal-dependent decarboxylase [Terriglobales bacterium]|jgi:aromatic-L-amino-acid decarboxylase|nr:pyridoxal-dependent decarboxylase [Terriglobales bacterium]